MPAIKIAELASLLGAKFEGNGNLVLERPVNPDCEDVESALAIATAPSVLVALRRLPSTTETVAKIRKSLKLSS